MRFDEEAIKITAERLEKTIEEVINALEIEHRYRGIHQNLKGKRKQVRLELIKKLALEKEKLEHPERCFCSIEHTFNDKDIIRYDKKFGYRGFLEEGIYETPVYKCQICGKEYEMILLYA